MAVPQAYGVRQFEMDQKFEWEIKAPESDNVTVKFVIAKENLISIKWD